MSKPPFTIGTDMEGVKAHCDIAMEGNLKRLTKAQLLARLNLFSAAYDVTMEIAKKIKDRVAELEAENKAQRQRIIALENLVRQTRIHRDTQEGRAELLEVERNHLRAEVMAYRAKQRNGGDENGG